MRSLRLNWQMVALALAQVLLLTLSGLIAAGQYALSAKFATVEAQINAVNVRLEDHMAATGTGGPSAPHHT